MKQNLPKLRFIKNFNKEYWFIKNKFAEAKQQIGEKRFIYIVNQNIPIGYNKNEKIFYKNLKAYLEANKNNLIPAIKQKSKIIENRWGKFEKKFFEQAEKITKIKWKYKTYKIYFIHSCFWGGDYDKNKSNIYINPLLEYGDPLYIIFHELSHLLYWEYIFKKYPANFIEKNDCFLWQLSEVMVNYPLLKMKIDFQFPLIIPKNLEKFGKNIIEKCSTNNFIDIIENELKKAG